MKKFSYEDNGYSRREVNDFVDEVLKETETIVSKLKNQQSEIEKLQKEVDYYREMKDMMKNALTRAEESSNKIKKMAIEESEILIRDAKDNASRIVNEALLKAKQTEEERTRIEKNMKVFKEKLRNNMQENMHIIEEIDKMELNNE